MTCKLSPSIPLFVVVILVIALSELLVSLEKRSSKSSSQITAA